MVLQNARDQPVASTDFAKLGHGILKQRFVRACVYQLAFAYIAGVLASMNLRNGIFSLLVALVSRRTLAYTLVSYGIGVAVLALHAQLFQVTRGRHSSQFPKLQRLLRSPASTGMAVGAYMAMAHVMLALHSWVFSRHGARLWLYPEGQYGPPQLNPAWLSSWAFATVLGASYGVQLVVKERLQLLFPSIEQSRIYTLKDSLPTSIKRAFWFAVVVLRWFWVVYFIFGWAFYRSVCGFLGHLFTTSSYGVSNPLLSLGQIVFWLHGGTLVVLTWESAHRLFEVVATEPTHISELSRDRNLCLLNGLKHTDSALIQHLAYQELYRLTDFGAEQRMDILSDIDRTAGTMWSLISDQCIAVIKTATEQLQAHQQQQQHKSAASGGDKKAGEQKPGASVPDKAAEADLMSARAGGAPMSTILRMGRKGEPGSASPAPAPAAAAKPAPASQDLFEPEAQGLEKYVLTTLRDALLQSKVGQGVLSRSNRGPSTSAFANFQQQVWAVRSLVRLVVCSIDEDKYGVVQGDIGKVLGVLFAYLEALERCLVSSDAASGDFNVQVASRQPQVMAQVVRHSLYCFTTSFYEHLEALKLPTMLARKLQAFADFQA
ncbi:Nuclear pore complex subunit [Coemansia sp. Benny D115]|nr:Nuclear pore complex subunit [Coemansia sp. Benny D115]